ncbi:hypothetical protein [Butyrivibrio sp. JL13D10]|uniref:hypothetical protein n=1 Tax=Butyrivibrio sp. JL13D10 TaxID=3236815 RepID=UPI0038B6A6B4
MRKIIRAGNSAYPDMVNTKILVGQVVISFFTVLFMMLVFAYNWIKLNRAMSLIEESDKLSMALLQQEVMGQNIPALSGESIFELLELWGVILVGVRAIYEISSLVYRQFILQLTTVSFLSPTLNHKFTEIYNTTHGFKYISMLTALLLGAFITGIFLHDRKLKAAALILISLFMLSIVLIGMQTITIGSYSIGIVWSSLIFHLTETLGLVSLGIYLRKKYIGL